MKRICVGLLAHVDAGKTTLSEAILYRSGAIRKMGRVDHKDAFLDTDTIERDRGITVFSKEARFSVGEKEAEKEFILLDTPGHRDFSTEMERVLSVLDYAVLIVSGTEGVQAHTLTLWKLLEQYKLPTIIYINKMDMAGADKDAVLSELRSSFGFGFTEFTDNGPEDAEDIAGQDEELMEKYIEGKAISTDDIARVISEQKVYPVICGSALRMTGIDDLLSCLNTYTAEKTYPPEFAARVYKITRDKKGNRETRMKILGGSLKVKDNILTSIESIGGDDDRDEEEREIREKAEQIREYRGESFDTVQIAMPGDVVTITGLTRTYAGQGLGTLFLSDSLSVLEPPLTYKMYLSDGTDPLKALQKLEILSEENPSLNIIWNEELHEIQVTVMGELELEILASLIKTRFDMDVRFGQGSIIYKETLSEPVIGIGHYEPLRHYAEVQLLLKPNPRGAGMSYGTMVSEDELSKNWQRLIMTHLKERRHRGTLTRSEITDIDIEIIAGKAHLKHTMGGDFRQSTYRAIRQGLRAAREEGKVVLLEPMYSFTLEIPQDSVGRAMSDMDRLFARCSMPEIIDDVKTAAQNAPVTISGQVRKYTYSLIKGTGPVSTLYDYQTEVNKYTGGTGRFTAILSGYMPCHNQDEVAMQRGYDPDADKYNPCGSVFCEHGAGMYVEWNRVNELAHTEACFRINDDGEAEKVQSDNIGQTGHSANYGSEKELKEIFEKTYGKSKRDEQYLRDRQSKATRLIPVEDRSNDNFPKPNLKGSKGNTHMIVDGYNVIFQWEELKDMASANFDAAREVLIDVLQNYQGYRKIGITCVFDGYKVHGNPGTEYNQGDLKIVYTKEGQTADRYIEEMVYALGKTHDITCITSDLPVQMAAHGDGAKRMSAREFHEEVTAASSEIRKKLAMQRKDFNRPFEEKLKRSN